MTQTEPSSSTETAGAAQPIRVAVVTGYALLIEAIERIVEAQEDLHLIRAIRDPAQAVELTRTARPDVLLLLRSGSTVDELDLIQRVGDLGNNTKILMLSANGNQHTSLRMLRAGAHGILAPSISSDEVIQAIRSVHRGDVYLTPQLQRACAERYLGVDTDKSPEERLSDREFQVMRLLALGYTNREIASQLGVGVKTIDTHRANLLRKLELRNNADVARFAMTSGIIEC